MVLSWNSSLRVCVCSSAREVCLKNIFLGNRKVFGKSHGRVLTSPFFPAFYPTDLIVEYVIDCNRVDCNITVLFTDFLVAPPSMIEVSESLVVSQYERSAKNFSFLTGMGSACS